MTEQQFNELVEKVGKEAATKVKTEMEAAEKRINDAADRVNANKLDKEAFEVYKEEQLQKINEQLVAVEKLENAMKEQGNKINAIIEKAAPGSKTLEEFLIEQFGEKGEKLKELKAKNGMVEFTASQLKAAGVISIGTTIQPQDAPPNSPYLPGIGGPELELFDIRRNPNFMLNRVSMGRTNQSRLAWINELGEEGSPAEVLEGGEKPQIDVKFKVETSTAKKAAAWMEITEEFEEDVPNLAAKLRPMLRERVVRFWDDSIQIAVEAIAQQFDAASLQNSIPFANYWDAALAMVANVYVNNFIPNTIAIHPYTNVKMQADKTVEGIYLLPSFKDQIQGMLVQANKLAVDNALVGDLSQYNVDVYKEFVLKVGWINDQFIHNKFSILGELRYHRYISDNRRKAILKANLGNVANYLDGGSGS